MRAVYAVEGGRLAYGALQLLVPERLCAVVGQRPSGTTLTLTRVLGARHLIQGVLHWRREARPPTASAPRWTACTG
jgi:hypothetical protein